jgi:hypothetical protein
MSSYAFQRNGRNLVAVLLFVFVCFVIVVVGEIKTVMSPKESPMTELG